MGKIKKTMAILMCVLTLLSVCCFAAGCPQKEPEDKKYDVTIKIACQETIWGYEYVGPILNVWYFTPDIDEMHIERKYDGKQYRYFVYQYNLPNHPLLGNDWSEPSFGGPNYIYTNLYSLADDAPPGGHLKFVCEKGEYMLEIRAEGSSTLWNRRSANFFITVV